jgi:ubiquinone/menaquinone biosynthesis C-methylase UbiE
MTVVRRRIEARARRRQDRRAGLWPEPVTLGDSRRWICSRSTGRVLEVCVGTGLNLPNYPPHVSVTAVDLDPERLTVARVRAAELRRPVALVSADAARLPFGPGGFDTVVCTLAMCEFDNRTQVLDEMYRVLRPGGRLLLLDHAQWRWLSRGRPVTLAAEVGFTTYRHERLRLGLIERLAARHP